MPDNHVCSVCQTPVANFYCSHCGQKMPQKATTVFSLASDFISGFFSLEKSVFAALVNLLANPLYLVNNYYAGYRNYYASPAKVLLYTLALMALQLHFFDTRIMGLSIDVANLSAPYLFWILLLPLLCGISYIAFIRSERAFAKHVISLTYIACTMLLLLTLLYNLVQWWWGDVLGVLLFPIFLVFVFWWNSRVLSPKKTIALMAIYTLWQILLLLVGVALLLLPAIFTGNVRL